MAIDPSVPADVKKRLSNGVRSNALPNAMYPHVEGLIEQNYRVRSNALPNAMYPQPSVFGNVQSGVGVNDGTVAPTPEAVSVGPVRPGVIDASNQAPPSPLDANAPLPAGVKRYTSGGYTGTPGTNDVIYEGRGAHGERAFSNNQFSRDLRGGVVNPGLEALAKLRLGEINAYTTAQQAAANAAAGAAATAPKTADELTRRLTANADAAGKRVDTQLKVAQGKQQLEAGANTNELNDQFTKASDAAKAAAKASGASDADAIRAGQIAAAKFAAAARLDPTSPNLPADVRAGDTAIRQNLAALLNRGASFSGLGSLSTSDTPSQLGKGVVDNATAYSPAEYSIERPTGSSAFNPTQLPVLVGPPDKNGVRRRTFITPQQADEFQPYITAALRGLQRKSSPAG